MREKYQKLQKFMNKTPRQVTTLTLSFDQIEVLIGAQLPKSAAKYRQWWANQRNNQHRPQARAWMSAGFKVDKVDLLAGQVIFSRYSGLFT